ncbi:ankyrin repeat domain-containing protein [candidate division KSB1 bacterium]|nr:ankyrin repeat domain-containing protein [candidate division KSB1 bacterium]
MDIELLRESFKPNRIRLLLIGESAPNRGKFFYEGEGCIFTTYTKHVFEKVFRKSFSDNSDFLEFFKGKNCYLEDLCQIPIDNTVLAERKRIREESVKDLAQRLETHQTEHIAIVGKNAHLGDQIKRAIEKAGLSCPIDKLYFAGQSHQNKYKAGLEKILRKIFKNNMFKKLHEAIKSVDLKTVSEIINKKPSIISETNELGWTPIHIVSAQGIGTVPEHTEITRLLISKGADVNSIDLTEFTPLHLIAAHGSKEALEVAKLLLENGADPNIRSKFGGDMGTTPLMLWQHGKEIRNLLVKYGATL